MLITGKYKFSNNHWIGTLPELDVIQIGKSKEELLINMKAEINNLLSYDDLQGLFDLSINEDESFTLKFLDQTAFSSFIFKTLRRKAKLSQSNVASKLEIVRTSYTQYEEAKKEPTLSKFNEILNAMGFQCEISIKKISSL
jgi:hypothetical protein